MNVRPILLTVAGDHGNSAAQPLVGEEPTVYYMHFWADASLADVLRGLRAVLEAAR